MSPSDTLHAVERKSSPSSTSSSSTTHGNGNEIKVMPTCYDIEDDDDEYNHEIAMLVNRTQERQQSRTNGFILLPPPIQRIHDMESIFRDVIPQREDWVGLQQK